MHTALRYIALGSLFIIPFLPLYVAGDLFFPFITGKAFAFRILIELGAAAWIALAIADPKYRPKFSWVLVIAAALVAWTLIADFFAVNPHKAFWSNFERMDGWVTLVHVFAFMVFASAMLTAENLWRRWWLVFLSGTALIVGYGLLQIAGTLETHQGDRIDASFGNAAYLPAYLLFCIGVALWQALQSKGWLRNALLALAAFAAIIVLFSATRGAFLGLLGGAFVGVILWLIEGKGAGRKMAFGVLIAIVVVAGSLFLLRGSPLISGSETLSRLSTAFDLSSLEVRFTIWNMALQGIAERPIVGWGHEGFNYVFAKYYDPSLFAQEPWFDRAHNVFLDYAIAGGVPALLLFLAFLLSILIALYRGPFSRVERVMLVGALAAYSIQGLAVFDNLFTYVPLFAIAGMVHGRIGRSIPMLEANVPERALGVVGPFALTLSLVVVWVVNVPNIQASAKLIDALSARSTLQDSVASFKAALAQHPFGEQEIREHLVTYADRVVRSDGVPDADKAAVASFAVSEMEKEIARAPLDARLRLQIAAARAIAADKAGAYRELEEAIRLSPKKQTTYIQYGTMAWQFGDYARAHDALMTAYTLDPSFDIPAAYAAAGKVITGDTRGAEAILMEAYGTPIVDTDFLRLAYFQTGQYGKLVEIGKKGVDDTNGSPEARLNYALLLAIAGRIGEAKAEIEATVQAFPQVADDAADLLRRIDAAAQ